MSTLLPLQRSQAPRALLVLVVALLALTSLTPLVQFGNGGVTISIHDVIVVLVSMAVWIPFLTLAARLIGRDEGGWRRTPWVLHLILAVVALAVHSSSVVITGAWLSGDPVVSVLRSSSPSWVILTALGLFQYATVLSMLLAMHSVRAADRDRVRAAMLQVERAQLREQLQRATVDTLRARFQPHFLFNTLNSVLVLTQHDPDGARVMIRKLSDLLRAAIADDAGVTVTLRRELELVESYLAIQRVRFTTRLRSRTDVDPLLLDTAVPAFILQPIVENAIQYAVAPREDGGSMTITVRGAGGRLLLSVCDDGPGCEPGAGSERGLGLRGCRARLAHVYGDDATVTLVRGEGGGCEVRLDVPIVANGPTT
ncbi:MAG: histidine kinase [Cytophagaceae bacterium]|nr:histidine kinase [Gemmatimonadaceae bacterium]